MYYINQSINIIFCFILVATLSSLDMVDIDNESFKKLSNDYCANYKALNIPRLKIRYKSNLELIKSNDSIKLQEDFFRETAKQLKSISRKQLEDDLQIDYNLMLYETELNLERTNLEKQWKKLKIDSIPEAGLYHLPLGKEWYEYFLKKWLSDDVTPDEVFEFGLQEIKKVKREIKTIQRSSGKDSLTFYNYLNENHFYYTDTLQIENAIQKTKINVEKRYAKLFPFTDSINPVKVKHSKNEFLRLVPAYYSNSTFYYTFFDEPFNSRLVDIFFLHEGMPGHHYQIEVNNALDRTEIRKLTNYLGYMEGWAAYVEELGKELGVYKTDYDYLGKWEWDIVRSIRVCLDIGINYYGWSDEKAIAFWKTHIPNQDEIISREIKRMKLQPAQVITYKYGASQILKWKENEMNNQNFNIKDFHQKVLENGSLPFAVLNQLF